ncbi:2-deoxyribose-5-phosphate aldolase, NAD(P)-linked [Bosea sp. 62]|uniref:deoxyribose-phosphate aldolase n=1 Tax=unclassified Bosea (in: a-proteobacteria) TaxID=2653178 RepID=UPI0012563A9D|nr:MULTISPECIES: deoxyribose-phosphate aldolase [unclassified Bosea (in: a-proteobacteria)]CAD5284886.1 2-deoxyribose-5-phosphate aldolase, NAD(P)-linked [Bosea sp. 21B]CAD5287625.1 2-deoxyribose-5-phosphate aldolase, NAD(P)-linked [Bosea sp. 46]CAD5301598.1 2-deoxyribose-5-phosphate aldolase, NAD(P)-linked [Bosea sp. 7B]VVT51270.1 2-deoxyribose-5-phosphate aldolase, NAD(P)-linked [Bosea sp. EC-HK365B]VXB11321.1 2-deoxyribose-5-phosphate aldolase, NAD(P)-linked [Bosea sp. 62]
MSDADLALRALRLLDLTDLSDQASEAGTLQLCARAVAAPGPVAAICIWPQLLKLARQTLKASPVRIATVINFPAGNSNCNLIGSDITEAIADGADEIDLVLPWRAFLAGDAEIAREMVAEARGSCGDRTLKVILETGEYPDQGAVRAASELAIAAGADFIKTSTGKTKTSATPAAARTMLEAIKASGKPVGLKPSGGLRTLADARTYLDLAEEIMGSNWATAKTFRFGASGLYGVLADIIAGTAPAERTDGAY